MNERIKLLAEQAGAGINYTDNGEPSGVHFNKYETFEKFAELIVRECAGVIAPMGDWCGGHGEPSMPSTMECAKRLKQHFGVEK